MATSLTATGISFPDGSSQTTAAVVRAGATTLTLTSSTPILSLNTSSPKVITLRTDSTIPVRPSIQLPPMNTGIPIGEGYFTIINQTGLSVALLDFSFNIIEYLPPETKATLVVTDISSANGSWGFNPYPIYAGMQAMALKQLMTSSDYQVNTGLSLLNQTLVTLDTQALALCWHEWGGIGGTVYTYAKLIIINTTANTFTLGNTVLISSGTGSGTSYVDAPKGFMWDTDNTGKACVLDSYVYSTYNGAVNVTGLFYTNISGTLTLSATRLLVYNGSIGSPGCCAPPNYQLIPQGVAYLGSTSAYAVFFSKSDGTNYYTGAVITISGANTVVVTQTSGSTGRASAASTSVITRTGVTSFIQTIVTPIGGGIGNYYINYLPATNTLTSAGLSSPSLTNVLPITVGNISKNISFGQGGFVYSAAQVLVNKSIWNIVNPGTSSVSASISTTSSYRNFSETTFKNIPFAKLDIEYVPSSSLYHISSAKVIGINQYGRIIKLDPSNTNYIFDISAKHPTTSSSISPILSKVNILGSISAIFSTVENNNIYTVVVPIVNTV